MNSAAPQFHLGYRPGLDGIRGVAILFVVLVHIGIIHDGFGFVGINTFFVLSGFLITSLLVTEWRQTGNISFRDFYIRRALRLFPALIAMLAAFLIYAFLFDPPKRAIQELHEAFQALFYYTNWARIFRITRTISLVHTWSLSVEEQFYIVWPFLLLLFLRKMNRESLLCWIFLGALLSVLLRIGLLVGGTDYFAGNVFSVNLERLVVGLDTRADSLLLGCFAGVLLSTNFLPDKKLTAILTIAAIVSGVGLLVIGALSFLEERMICFGWLLASIFAAILVVQQVSTSQTVLHWILENPVLVYVGKISYGLYIWNYPIIGIIQHQHFSLWNLGFPWGNLVLLIPIFAVVLASYYLIERPCLRLKRRFQKVS